MDLVPVNLKDNELALKNCAFLSTQFAKDPSRKINVKIKNRILKAHFNSQIQKNKIGMSKNLRQFLGVDMVNSIRVDPHQPKPDEETGLSYLKLDLNLHKKKDMKKLQVDDAKIIDQLKKIQTGTFFNPGQTFYLKFDGNLYILTVLQCFLIDSGFTQKRKEPKSEPGMLIDDTQVELTAGDASGLILTSGESQAKNLFRPDFKIEDMGIGGLDDELFNIFRRTFASRRFPASVVQKFGIKHVKGILLYGPPGTGKTLIARQLAKALNAKNLQIVNGPQIFSKFHGESEQNIRKLFAKARQDEKTFGDTSPLHVIVFDEIDAICKQRGVHSGGSQVSDQVVNQLLTNIDGVQALNNIVVIGMTNRKDLLDDAILRSGRLQVHIEVKLPNNEGRQQIIRIHTKKLTQNNLLSPDCNIEELGRLTRNFTGAQIEALVKSASSHSIARTTNFMEFGKDLVIKEDKLSVTRGDFLKALEEVKPQFGTDEEKFSSLLKERPIDYGESYEQIVNNLRQTTIMPDSEGSQIRSVILYGRAGVGKTMVAVNYAKHCTFPYIKIISPENYLGYTDSSKIQAINKIFEDAYKTTNACIVIDDIERLIQFTPVGRRFTNSTLQALLILISKTPPKNNCKLLIVATTSLFYHLDELDIPSVFDVKIQISPLKEKQIAVFLTQKFKMKQSEAGSISKALGRCSIKNLLQIGDLVENKADVGEWKFFQQNMILGQEEKEKE